MANSFLGEISIEHDGETYVLRCDFNAMAAFEEKTGQNALEAFAALEGGGQLKVSDLIAMMWAFLQRHHPEASQQFAGDLLSADVETLTRLIKAASPTEGEAGNRKAAGRKKKA